MADPVLLSVVVPTRNEAGNVGPLLERVFGVLQGVDVEVCFVDDSDDETPALWSGSWPSARAGCAACSAAAPSGRAG
jgi:dolichol-phosphate mannosyltransferase